MAQLTSMAFALIVLLLATSCYGQNGTDSQSGVASLQFDFDCRRHQEGCANNKECNLQTGHCECGEGNFNYLCEDTTESGTCNKPCENGGKCVDSKCVCGPNNYGTSCQMMRVQLQCEAQKMFVNIKPHGNFTGLIYLYDDPDCALQEGQGNSNFGDYIENPNDLDGWRLELEHTMDKPCGKAAMNSTMDAKSGQLYTSFSRKFFIQYKKVFKSSVDQLITAECKVSNGSATIYGDVNEIADMDGNYQEVNVDDEVQVVTLEILKGDDKPVGEEVMLGEPIKLVFTMIEGTAFTDFRLASCKANNTIDKDVDNGNFSEVEFVKDGCPTSQASALFSGDIAKSLNPPRWTVSMKAFMFTGISQKVAFVCSVVFCDNDTSAECQKKPCPGYSAGTTGDSDASSPPAGGNGGGNTNDTDSGANGDNTSAAPPTDISRKRRAAGNQETVSKVINVQDPLTEVKKVLELEKEEKKDPKKECIEEPSVMAAVIILAVCVVVLLVLCAVLLYRLMRSRHKVATVHRTGTFAEPVQSMRIPRLELNTSPYA